MPCWERPRSLGIRELFDWKRYGHIRRTIATEFHSYSFRKPGYWFWNANGDPGKRFECGKWTRATHSWWCASGRECCEPYKLPYVKPKHNGDCSECYGKFELVTDNVVGPVPPWIPGNGEYCGQRRKRFSDHKCHACNPFIAFASGFSSDWEYRGQRREYFGII